jgi:diguanylate cyclase (GGDEF)-like protein
LGDDVAGVAVPARILHVGDDPRTALLIGEMLRSVWPSGVVLARAERLPDAAQELLERSASCVLLDISLPGTDQLAWIEQIRTAAPDAAIVVIADRDDDLELAVIEAGAQDYLIRSELYPALFGRALRHAIQRKRGEVKLSFQALHDSLTGLPNRALFLDRLGVALDRSRRTNASIAVLFLDVDDFKQINDSLGHAAGDRLLVGLADRLRGMLRPMDTVARFGGDEFTFLFEELGGEREAVLIAERISRTASIPIALDHGENSITVSIGIAMVTDASIYPETVIREADAAMYRAKELGRSRYELFDEASRQRANERLELEDALRRALERSELRVHYQPKVSLGSQLGVVGFEALVRWEHPDRGLIPPRDFIPLADETGLVMQIGEYVVRDALRQVMRWRQLRPELTVAVNLSLRQLEDSGLVPMLAGAMRATAADPSVLCLEISESAVTHNPDLAARVLHGLRTIGVGITIDDYGSGSSSLASLKRLPIDTLKIHESFVTGLGSDPDETPIVGAVVGLGHALGLTVMAEGVETDAQLAELRALGCDRAQGYLFGRPVPEQEVQALLS